MKAQVMTASATVIVESTIPTVSHMKNDLAAEKA